MSHHSVSTRRAILKEVFWRPAVGLVAALDALFTLFSAFRHTIFANLTFNWGIIDWVFSWQWQTWLALWSAVWILVILQGAVTTVRRREAIVEELDKNLEQCSRDLESRATKGQQLETEAKELRDTLSRLGAENQQLRTRQEKAARISVSLKTEHRPRSIIVNSSSQFSAGQGLVEYVFEMSLVVYNHGEKSIRLRGAKLWKLHAVEIIQDLSLEEMVPADDSKNFDVTEAVLRVISAGQPLILESLPGEYAVRLVATYSEGMNVLESGPFDFLLTCAHGRGEPIKITATEVPTEQS